MVTKLLVRAERVVLLEWCCAFCVGVGLLALHQKKSSWLDFDNPAVLEFFDKFWRQWKKHFRYGVISKNIKFGGEGFARDIGYSPGVVKWQRKGGELGQEGVANGRFFLPPSAESSK
jgi:hypothetical protein